MHSTNDREPDFGPELPVYPPLEQTIRVAAPALAGTSPKAYPAYTQQWVPPLSLRDREPCYLVEPNGIALVSGYYTARLVSNLFGLPLYVATCCPSGGASLASASSSSGSSSSPLVLTATRNALSPGNCFSGLPLTMTLIQQPGALFGGFGPYCFALTANVDGCGDWIGSISGISFNFFGTPYWIFDDGTHDGPIATAEAGWSLTPFFAVFDVIDNITGAEVLVTVTQ